MADTNEEQLLNDLLREVSAPHGYVAGADLEARVLSAWDAGKTRRKPDTRYFICGAAAIVALAVMLPTSQLAPIAPTAPVARLRADTHIASARQAPVARLRADTHIASARQAPVAPVAPVAPFAPVSPTAELAGPFQVVRVQMPRSSLGMLMSPLEHPGEMIEADVLLGEDGMARAIHVSTNGSVNLWRSR